MKTTVVHCKKKPFDIYIGRPSRWGNPFSSKPSTLAKFRVETVDEALDRYEAWLPTQPDLMASLGELKGKVLGCWCSPGPCHGHILAHFADLLDS